MTKIWCIHCRKKRSINSMKNIKKIKTKNNHDALTGYCPVCSTLCYKLI